MIFSTILRAMTPNKNKREGTHKEDDSNDVKTPDIEAASPIAASPLATNAATNTATASSCNTNISIPELWKTLDRELRVNIGTSVKCGICLSTVVTPMRTPCVHAFCRDCILASLHSSNKCPECNTRITRRSLQPFEYLEALATNYKQLLVECGFCPSKYNPHFTTLTQKVQVVDDDGEGAESQDSSCASAPSRCLDRWQVATTWKTQALPVVKPPLMQIQENQLVVQANQRAVGHRATTSTTTAAAVTAAATTTTATSSTTTSVVPAPPAAKLPSTQEVQDQAREQQAADWDMEKDEHEHEEAQEESQPFGTPAGELESQPTTAGSPVSVSLLSRRVSFQGRPPLLTHKKPPVAIAAAAVKQKEKKQEAATQQVIAPATATATATSTPTPKTATTVATEESSSLPFDASLLSPIGILQEASQTDQVERTPGSGGQHVTTTRGGGGGGGGNRNTTTTPNTPPPPSTPPTTTTTMESAAVPSFVLAASQTSILLSKEQEEEEDEETKPSPAPTDHSKNDNDNNVTGMFEDSCGALHWTNADDIPPSMTADYHDASTQEQQQEEEQQQQQARSLTEDDLVQTRSKRETAVGGGRGEEPAALTDDTDKTQPMEEDNDNEGKGATSETTKQEEKLKEPVLINNNNSNNKKKPPPATPTRPTSRRRSSSSRQSREPSSANPPADEEASEGAPISHQDDSSSTAALWSVGSIVTVQSRTWPGVNKPGGVARITKRNTADGTLNVAYVLGGKESNVDGVFLSSVSPSSSNEEEHGSGNGSGNAAGKRKRRETTELPTSLLLELANQGFDTGISVPQRRVMKKERTSTEKADTKKETLEKSKRALQDVSNRKRSTSRGKKPAVKPTKTSMTETKAASKPAKKSTTKTTATNRRSQKNAEGAPQEDATTVAPKPTAASGRKRKSAGKAPPKCKSRVSDSSTTSGTRKKSFQALAIPAVSVPDLSNDEACKLADERYRERFEKALEDKVIHIVASNLSDSDMNILQALCTNKALAQDGTYIWMIWRNELS
jgi:hypothetical protein